MISKLLKAKISRSISNSSKLAKNFFQNYIYSYSFSTKADFERNLSELSRITNHKDKNYLNLLKKTIEESENYLKSANITEQSQISNNLFSAIQDLLKFEDVNDATIDFVKQSILTSPSLKAMSEVKSAMLYLRVGEQLLNKEQIKDGYELVEKSLDLYEKIFSNLITNEEINGLIDCLKILYPQSSKQIFSKAIAFREKVGNKNQISNLYSELSLFLGTHSEKEQQLEYLEDGLSIKKKLYGENKRELMNSLALIGDYYFDVNKSKSLDFYQQSNSLFLEDDQNGDFIDEYNGNLKKICEIMNERQDFDGLVRYFNSQLKYIGKLTNQQMAAMAYVYIQLGLVQLSSNTKDSKENMKKAAEILDQAQITNLETVTAYSTLGSIECQEGKMGSAMKSYERALGILNTLKLKDHPFFASTLGNIGLIHNLNGDWNLSLDYFNDSASILEANYKDSIELADCYFNLGRVYYQLKNYEQSSSYLEKSESLARKLLGENSSFYGDILLEMGLVSAAKKDAEAKNLTERALKIYNNLSSQNISKMSPLITTSKIYCDLGDLQTAKAYLAEAEEYSKSIESSDLEKGFKEMYAGLIKYKEADFEGCIKDFDKAIKYLTKFYGISNLQTAIVLNHIGEAHEKLNEKEKSLSFYKQAFEIRSEYLDENNVDLQESIENVKRLEELNKVK